MVELSVMLKRGCLESACEALRGSNTVIPPGNPRISKQNVSPKTDGVKDKFSWCSVSFIKDALSALMDFVLMEVFLGSGRTPNFT